MRKALIVGIDHYKNLSPLSGAVNDAYNVKNKLERDADGTVNFTQPRLLVSANSAEGVSRSELRSAVEELFQDDTEIALFYFAGHGYTDSTGGYICPSDYEAGGNSLPLHEVMTLANKSRSKNKVIILDSCHSGVAGDSSNAPEMAEIKDGVTILTASTENQYATEVNGSGLFTTLLVDALNGAAANLLGEVTPGSVYAHIDQSLGPWGQRPVFKTNVKKFVSLRKTYAPVSSSDLRKLTTLFPNKATPLELDPSYEPDRKGTENQTFPPPDPENNADFAILQSLVKVNLVKPVDATHMYYAAMESKSCKLTVLGEHYWNLVKEGLI